MAKGKNPNKRNRISKKVRILQEEIAESRAALINGLADNLMAELEQRLAARRKQKRRHD